tara:strand:- start:230 stop:1228 length:999 start_codon:yes stop_codon:yes gene_type:complete
MEINWNKLSEIVGKSNKIVLSTHINPDGDGLGSEVAIYYYLKSLGKDCRIINISELSEKYYFLNKNNIIETYEHKIHEKWISECDLAMIFDIGSYTRLGEIATVIKNNKIFNVSIDHHPSDDTFFSDRFLDVAAPATGFLVWKYFKSIKFDLSKDVSEALYAALINDTGSFRYNSTTPECHVMAKEILEAGVKPYDVFANIYESRTLPQVRLLSAVINSLNIVDEFASIKITQNMLTECDASLEDVDGFTDFARSIKGVEVAFMLSEVSKNKFRINFRSRGKYIINDIAQSFNGGGHKLAAGATVDNITLEDLENKIFNILNKKRNLYVNKI